MHRGPAHLPGNRTGRECLAFPSCRERRLPDGRTRFGVLVVRAAAWFGNSRCRDWGQGRSGILPLWSGEESGETPLLLWPASSRGLRLRSLPATGWPRGYRVPHPGGGGSLGGAVSLVLLDSTFVPEHHWYRSCPVSANGVL